MRTKAASSAVSTRSFQIITPDVPLVHSEGLFAIDHSTFALTEDLFDQPENGRLIQLSVDANGEATTKVLASALEGPTNVVLTRNSFWVTEGQVTHLLDPSSGAPNLPFRVRRLEPR